MPAATTDLALFLIVVLTASWLLRPRGRAWRLFLVGASAVFYLDLRQARPNPLILLVIALMALLAAAVLRAAFPSDGARAHAPDPARIPAPLAPTTTTATDEPAAPPVTDPAVLWGAPATVLVLALVANVVLARAFPAATDERGRGLAVLVGLVLVGQAFALAIHRAGAGRRALVAAAVGTAVAVLGWCRYAGWYSSGSALVPVGLSFLVLGVISYVVDVGRDEQEPVSLLDATVHFTFFPRVLAGPVLRVRELVPQLAAPADPRHVATGEAFALILRGLVKKVLVSGFLAAQITGPVLAAPDGYTRFDVLVAVVALSVQIYADVSGYLDLAAGAALLFGLRFPRNFDAPFRARSLTDFWRRWNLTLMHWFRDYLYRPLGGSPAAVVVAMLVFGLWHGTGLAFVVWAAIHAAVLVVEHRRRGGPGHWPAPLAGVLTFAVVSVAWVFFAARDVGAALAVLTRLVMGGEAGAGAGPVTPLVVLVVAGAVAVQFVPVHVGRRLVAVLGSTPPAVQVVLGAAALLLIRALAPDQVLPFLYTRL